MSDRPEPAVGDTTNTLSGTVAGHTVQTGSISGGVHLHQATRQAARLPHRAGIVPPRAGAFQHRAAATLVRALEQNPVAVLTPDAIHAHVVTGLGGVGKTQLALDYAEHHWATRQVDLLVWVTAGSREPLVSSYARLTADLTGIDDPNPEHGAHRLLEWPGGYLDAVACSVG